jgi:hypothetical protein
MVERSAACARQSRLNTTANPPIWWLRVLGPVACLGGGNSCSPDSVDWSLRPNESPESALGVWVEIGWVGASFN